MNNYQKELNKQLKYKEAWNISKKYTTILIEHENKNEHLDIAANIYYQYISELKYKDIDVRVKNNYIQSWNTMINTVNNNPKINVKRASIKLLHQTSVQRA
jgi:predicted DNA-binding protein (UPF0278 family)